MSPTLDNNSVWARGFEGLTISLDGRITGAAMDTGDIPGGGEAGSLQIMWVWRHGSGEDTGGHCHCSALVTSLQWCQAQPPAFLGHGTAASRRQPRVLH